MMAAMLPFLVAAPVLGQSKWMKAGSLYFTFDALNEASPAEKARRDKYFYQYKCKVTGLVGPEEELFKKAISHIDWVLMHPNFQTILGRKKFWMGTKAKSDRVLYQLRHKNDRVIVNLFGQNEDYPCKTDKASGHTNAFASPPGTAERILFIFEDYLQEQMYAPEPIKGIRTLARTIIHESLHTLGYSHFNPQTHRTYPLGSVAYNNTVPVYVGCLTMNWGHTLLEQERVRQNCELADHKRQSSAYDWHCPGIDSFRKGEQVRFKLNQGWARGVILNRYKDRTVDLQSDRSVFENVSVCRLQKL